MSNNWIVHNLQKALGTWNEKMGEIWQLVMQSPDQFKGGDIWDVILTIHGALQAFGYGLLVIFFLIGLLKTCGSFVELKRPEQIFKVFVRFVLAKAAATYGLDIMLTLFELVQGVAATIMQAAGVTATANAVLPQEIITAVESCGFVESVPLWAVTMFGGIIITVLSFVMILTVYGRFFKLYLYTAIAPIPLSTFAGQPTQSTGVSFLRSYSAVCLEGAIIILSCVIFSMFTAAPPAIDPSGEAVTMVWSYIAELIFNMLILVGLVKMADRVVREMMGL